MQSNKQFTPLFEGIAESQYKAIDLSKSNKDLLRLDLSQPNNLQEYIKDFLHKKQGEIAYGGYKEVRNLYNHSTLFSKQKKQRNTHLGVDFWIEENTPILVPFSGKIHSLANNNNPGDYGPTIILEHNIKNEKIYSLYGHLSIKSLNDLCVGQDINKGDIIGEIGDASVNGGYAPHLHFQLMKDIQNYMGDYPGVAAEDELAFYSENCPNPLLYLGLADEV